MTGAHTLCGAGSRSAISATAGAGTRPSVTTRVLFGVARAKGTFVVLTRAMAGILARTMECWQLGLEGGLASGVVGREIDALTALTRHRLNASPPA
jgi:hypothetical protein